MHLMNQSLSAWKYAYSRINIINEKPSEKTISQIVLSPTITVIIITSLLNMSDFRIIVSYRKVGPAACLDSRELLMIFKKSA